MNEDMLLHSPAARRLYHEHAAGLPIIDYHCHLDPQRLASDEPFENITRLWIAPDQYKHRAMRVVGVPEKYITGDATDREKFDRWAATVPLTLGNPLFEWTQLELKRYFDIDEMLTPESADRIWERCNSVRLTPRQLLARSNVELVCTSNLPDEELLPLGPMVMPSLRDAEKVDAVRFDEFEKCGCRLSDHGVDDPRQLDPLLPLAREYARRGWVMQLHLGAQRETSSRLRAIAGPRGGYATIGNTCDIPALCQFLDTLDKEDALPRTILYPLNPADYAAIATLTGSFPGKLQFGPAWWFNDHSLGIRQHLEALASYGLLSTFIGMTTDSRSFLSMSRHEYFRRVLCNFLAGLSEDETLTTAMVRGICHDNAHDWLQP